MPTKRQFARHGLLERLERRDVCAGWQNVDLPCDVDNSALVTPIDALVVINSINRDGVRSLAGSMRNPEEPCLDVDGDNVVSPIDVLLVVNALNRNGQPLALTASLTPDDDPNFNGVVLGDQVHVRGATSPQSQIVLRRIPNAGGTSQVVWQGSSNGQGSFEVTLPMQLGINSFTFEARDELGRRLNVPRSWSRGDVVADWNATMLNAVRDWTGLSNDPYPNRIVPSRPPIVSRNLAMVHVAMFDAANAVEGRFESYLTGLPQDSQASSIAALATAAHRVASQLYSDRDETPVLDATLAASLATVPDDDAKSRGIRLGEQVAQRMLSERAADGSTSPPNYTPSNLPGRWNRTSPDFTPPELPQWRSVKPFAMNDIAALRVASPPALDSLEYAAAVDQVMRLGRLDSSERTREQTEIALFWADGAGTATPPGHWNRIASDLMMTDGKDLLEHARTLAILNLALADSAIAAWDNKYHYDVWRPVHAIQRADQDGNAATSPDPTWSPLLRTPAHPSYVSGHSTFSAAAAAVLTSLYGDEVAFISTTDPQSGLTQRPLAPELIATRRFTSFRQAAEEAGMSRIYAGIHFEFDNAAGKTLGRAIGESIVNQWLQPRGLQN